MKCDAVIGGGSAVVLSASCWYADLKGSGDVWHTFDSPSSCFTGQQVQRHFIFMGWVIVRGSVES